MDVGTVGMGQAIQVKPIRANATQVSNLYLNNDEKQVKPKQINETIRSTTDSDSMRNSAEKLKTEMKDAETRTIKLKKEAMARQEVGTMLENMLAKHNEVNSTGITEEDRAAIAKQVSSLNQELNQTVSSVAEQEDIDMTVNIQEIQAANMGLGDAVSIKNIEKENIKNQQAEKATSKLIKMETQEMERIKTDFSADMAKKSGIKNSQEAKAVMEDIKAQSQNNKAAAQVAHRPSTATTKKPDKSGKRSSLRKFDL